MGCAAVDSEIETFNTAGKFLKPEGKLLKITQGITETDLIQ